MAKKIIVLGGIGANDRKNRDGFRVLDRGGAVRRATSTHTYRATFGS